MYHTEQVPSCPAGEFCSGRCSYIGPTGETLADPRAKQVSVSVSVCLSLCLSVSLSVSVSLSLSLTARVCVQACSDGQAHIDGRFTCLSDTPGTCDLKLSYWAPVAKAAGACLNLNCSLILLPVLWHVLHYAHRKIKWCPISCLRCRIAKKVPLGENVVFHKLVAYAIAFFAAVCFSKSTVSIPHSFSHNQWLPCCWND